jgi:hypothetical protein
MVMALLAGCAVGVPRTMMRPQVIADTPVPNPPRMAPSPGPTPRPPSEIDHKIDQIERNLNELHDQLNTHP